MKFGDFFFIFFVGFSECLNFITQSVTLCIIFHHFFFSFFCRSTLKNMTSAARMSDGAAGIEPGDWGPGPPPPVFGIPPPPLPPFMFEAGFTEEDPSYCQSLDSHLAVCDTTFVSIYLGFFYEILCPHFKVLKCRKIVGS
jgi:hypothetical protein